MTKIRKFIAGLAILAVAAFVILCDRCLTACVPQFFGARAGLALVLSATAFALICICLVGSVLSGNISTKTWASNSLKCAVGTECAMLLGFLVALVLKKLPQGGSVPYIASVCVSVVSVVAAVLYYNASRRKVVRKATADSLRRSAGPSAVLRYARANVYGVSAVLAIAAVVGLMVGGAYYLFVVPMALSAVALILHKLTGWRGWFLFALVTLLLYMLEYSVMALPINGAINLVTEAPRLYALSILTCSLIDLYLAGE